MSSINKNNVTDFRDVLVEQLVGECEGLLKVVRHIPDDQLDFTPHPKSMPAGSLALHCATAIRWFVHGIKTGTFAGEENFKEIPTTSQALANKIDARVTQDLQDIRSLSADTLLKETPFFDGSSYSAFTYLNWGVWHLIHHRGQLSVYLRLMGAKVPGVYGPSGDEAFPIES